MKSFRCVTDGKCGRAGEGVPCEVTRLSTILSLPDAISEEARRICSTVVESGDFKRQPLAVLAASSLFAACRESRAPVTLSELAASSGKSRKEIGRSYRYLVSRLGITPPLPNGTRYVERVAAKVGASEDATTLALEIEKKSVDLGLGDRNPMTLAGAAVYTACLLLGDGKTQSEVAEAAAINEGSLRVCAQSMRKLLPLHEGSHSTEVSLP